MFQPACSPTLDARVFDAVVVSVERANYECQARESKSPAGCVQAYGASTSCGAGNALVIDLADGTHRTKQPEPPFVLAICELPPGAHKATLCTHDGPRTCTIELVPERGVIVSPVASLSARFRYHLRADHAIADLGGPELVASSDEITLQVGDRKRFTINPRARDPLFLDACNVRPIPQDKSPAQRGCAHCASGTPDLLAGIALAALLATRRRR